MRDDNGGIVRAIDWPEIFPWLNLYRSLWIAVGPRMLLLATVAILITETGWALFSVVLTPAPSPPAVEGAPTAPRPFVGLTSLVPDAPGLPSPEEFAPGAAAPGSLYGRGAEPVLGSWEHLSRPARQIFASPPPNLARFTLLLMCTVWAVAVWSFFGGAMTRVAAVRLATQEQVSLGEMFRFAARRWQHYFFAPIGTLLAALALAGLMAIGGLLLQLNWGVLLAGVFWWLALGLGLGLTILAIGLLLGWPLLWPSISADGSDGFGAIGNAFSFAFQRPLHFAFYLAVAALLGSFGWLLVSNLAASVVYFTYWAAGLGGGHERLVAVMEGSGSLGGVGQAGAVVIHFFCQCVKLVAVGFLYSYFWTAATAVYFLLRRDVDGAEMDEVFREEEEDADALPPLSTDAAGAPVIAEPAADESKKQG